jgi:hypothetical protein
MYYVKTQLVILNYLELYYWATGFGHFDHLQALLKADMH